MKAGKKPANLMPGKDDHMIFKKLRKPKAAKNAVDEFAGEMKG